MTSKPTSSISSHLYKLYGSSDQARNSILFEVHHQNQAHIILNRPKKFNSFSMGMYHVFADHLDQANQMEQVKYIVIRANGQNFSSGNDLGNFMLPDVMALQNKSGLSKVMANQLETLTEKIIKSEKPIFCIVQGKIVGFAFTQLALYDKVFAVEGSYFMAPLVKIAQGPEMASSYTFPRIFGQPLAQDIIIKGKPMNAPQLQKYNFVKCCPTVQKAYEMLQEHIKQLEELDWPSYVNARKLMREAIIQPMLKANRQECKNLVERWNNPDLPAYLMNYMAKRKEKKDAQKSGKPKL